MATDGNGIQAKQDKYFHCELCDYSTCIKYNYKNHINTIKHKNNVLSTNDNENQGNSSKKFECDICHKNYNDRTGLWKHKKKCCKKDDEINEISDKELIMMIIKQNAELIKENIDMKNNTFKNEEQEKDNIISLLLTQNKELIDLLKSGLTNSTT